MSANPFAMHPTIQILNQYIEELSKLEAKHPPVWGSMSAQRMVEHLTDSLRLSFRPHEFPQVISDNHVEKAQQFLSSDHPMPKNVQVEFATPDMPLRHLSIDQAVKELHGEWEQFNHHFKNHPTVRTLHPNFGHLNYAQWLQLHQKHFTHHLLQFGLHA